MITIACMLGNEIINFESVKDEDIESARIKLWNETGDSQNVHFRYWRYNKKNAQNTIIPNRI